MEVVRGEGVKDAAGPRRVLCLLRRREGERKGCLRAAR